jgi:membrane associated rhomboid family serine protease
MATDTVDQKAAHIRGLTVTTLASLAGVGAAVASSALTAGSTDPAGESVALYAVAGAILVQFPLLRVMGIDVEDFSAKDYLYVAFMTFALWFVSWGILLTSQTTITF